MSLDPAEFIDDLTPTEPPFDDPASQADDHIRAIKKAITQTFPGTFDGPLNLTPALLEGLGARLDTLEAFTVPTFLSPVSGYLHVDASDTGGAKVITGVGFEPSVVFILAMIVLNCVGVFNFPILPRPSFEPVR